MPFNKKFTEVYEDIIKPSLLKEGCGVARGDEYHQQRNIIRDIVDYLAQADLVIADLTGLNANVVYELGLAHALLKPTLIITQDLDKLPFNLSSYRTHRYSLNHKDVQELHDQLRQLVRLQQDGELLPENPVTDFLPGYSVRFPNNVENQKEERNAPSSQKAWQKEPPRELLDNA
jgi:hypothetical protein